MSHNQPSERLPLNYRDTTGRRPASHTGRGQHRPTTAKSSKTNDPLRPPAGLHPQSQQARRWRDLVNDYAVQLGERIKQEQVRAHLGSLVSLTLKSERLNDRVTKGEEVSVSDLVQLSQHILRLLSELGISAAPGKAETSQSSLKDHIARRARVK
jgi:hypothetical protein